MTEQEHPFQEHEAHSLVTDLYNRKEFVDNTKRNLKDHLATAHQKGVDSLVDILKQNEGEDASADTIDSSHFRNSAFQKRYIEGITSHLKEQALTHFGHDAEAAIGEVQQSQLLEAYVGVTTNALEQLSRSYLNSLSSKEDFSMVDFTEHIQKKSKDFQNHYQKLDKHIYSGVTENNKTQLLDYALSDDSREVVRDDLTPGQIAAQLGLSAYEGKNKLGQIEAYQALAGSGQAGAINESALDEDLLSRVKSVEEGDPHTTDLYSS